MAVRISILHDDNPAATVRHLLRPTETQAERDEQMARQLDAPAGAHYGSVPRVQADMAPEVQAALGLTPKVTPSREALEHLLGGNRADGAPLPRSRYAVDNGRRIVAVLITISPHNTVSLARALARTEAARAVFDSAHRGANAAVMAAAERDILGWTRRGAQGRQETRGRVGRVEIDHHTTRRTKTGHVAPMEHTENLVFSAVVTGDGRVGAFDLRRLAGRVGGLDAIYQAELARRLRAAGANVRMQDGVAVMAEVPPTLGVAIARRTAEATAWALSFAKGKGMVAESATSLDSLAPQRRTDLIKRGTRATQATSYDAVGDRAAWVREARQHGFEPRDLVAPTGAAPPAGEGQGTVLERSAALRRAAIERLQATVHMREAAAVEGQETPSVVRVAWHQRFLQGVQQVAREVQQAVRALAPSPSQQAKDRLAAARAALRRQTANVLRAVGHGLAWRAGAEAQDWIRAYRLGPMVRAAAAVVRWGAARIREAMATRRAVRQASAEAALERPAALRAAAVAELPVMPAPALAAVAVRARGMRQQAQQRAVRAVGLGATPGAHRMFSDARAAVLVRQMAEAAKGVTGPATPEALVTYGPPAPPRLGAARLREEVRANLPQFGPPLPPELAEPKPPVPSQPAPPPVPLGPVTRPGMRQGEAMLAVHGTPQNAMNTRARTLGALVAEGHMDRSAAAGALYRLWRGMARPETVKAADPDKVFAAAERRIDQAAEDAFVRSLQKQGAALRGTSVQEQGQALSQ
ncbi:relaxase domain-containing protein [Paracraurococcus lichenis]|uniref:Relaxase domain-containing protein n=1 Tax=Paracraurococcus lichenis TaxID=3064888 RepID=A0ABT9E8V8_9PROT|nr:relaxase domain-containing protein [Paracraurococcus sp. LOR1-02]MDO9712557.1 relaxase domain-containing protein [Paracraurococcus sp. LOR1-02]